VKPSGIITLTSDFGLSDSYVATMKGVILTINPNARLVDISHEIRHGSILQGARLIRETYPYFPEGTIHLAVIDPGVGGARRPIALQGEGHFFVGPDNGLFSPIIQDSPDAKGVHLIGITYFLPHVTATFHGRDIFAPVAAHLSLGVDLETMGPTIKDPLTLNLPVPHEQKGILYGQITHVDHFGNLITNIDRKGLEHFLESAQPAVEVGNLVLDRLCTAYQDVEEAEPLALVNSADWLEIAVNLGRASEYLGVDSAEVIGLVVKVGRS
jgi:S-adenosylmethionine hydrolase